MLERFLRGALPGSLDIPTGLGKTAVIAVWLVARVLGAKAPRRLVYVVDRRAVVDQATEVAINLRRFVSDTPALRELLGPEQRTPLAISTLRGQFADNRDWLTDPAAHAIVIGTVDMVGSRLLFEGYGISKKTRPLHAGMLGADTLFVLDEAHLVPAFEALLRVVSESVREYGPRDRSLAALIPSVRLLSLSATGKADRDAFRLTAKDYEHPMVRKRLDAKKNLYLRLALDPEQASLAEALASEAWMLCDEGTRPLRTIIFCNSRVVAQDVHEALKARVAKTEKASGGCAEKSVELLVGERRVYEREQVTLWLHEQGFVAGNDRRPTRPCFLVATSAGEVGIDLDAEHMVSDLVAWERMVQRLGRVNRRGDGHAQVVVLPSLPNKKERAALDKAIEDRGADERKLARRRETIDAARRALEQLPRGAGGGYDASPGALVALRHRAESDAELDAELTRATTPAPLHPALSRAVVESWSMTSLEAHAGRPDVQPWLRGWVDDDDPQTRIVWRAHLPVTTDGTALGDSDVEAFFDAAAPHLTEILELETSRVLPWLTKRVESILKKDERPAGASGEGARQRDEESLEDVPEVATTTSEEPVEREAPRSRPFRQRDVIAFVLSRESKPRPLTIENLLSKERVARRVLGAIEDDLRGGTLVVLDRVGGLEAGLLKERTDGGEDLARLGVELPFRVKELAADEAARDTDDGVDFKHRWRPELELAIKRDGEEEPLRLLVVESELTHAAASEEARSVGPAQRLDEHQEWAEAEAQRIARALELPEPYQRMLQVAARLHDEGKAADRWQRAFRAKPSGPWGKTESRPNQRLLDGYRHEFGSLLAVEGHPALRSLTADLRDLCLHLITAHHGFARPSIRTHGCEQLPPSSLQIKAQEVALRFTRLEQRWGPWGLAWWETLLRAADQEASRRNDERGRSARNG